MDDEVRRLRESLEGSEPARRAARDGAWRRLQHAGPTRARHRRFVWAGALAAVLFGLVLGRLAARRPETPARLQPRPDLAHGSAPTAPRPAPLPARLEAAREVREGTPARAASRPTRRRGTAGPETIRGPAPDHLVLNFVLPETGVRLIWIMDRKFDLEGGSQ
jgi:hypothetical protein